MFLFEEALIHFEVYTTQNDMDAIKVHLNVLHYFILFFGGEGGHIHKTKSEISHRIKYQVTH